MASEAALRDYIYEQLENKGFVSVGYGVTAADLDPLFDQFSEFLDVCDEPGGERFAEALAFTPTDPTAGADYFVSRRRVGQINPHSINPAPATEDKDIAHIGPRSLELATHRLRGNVPSVMRTFLLSCVELQQATLRAIRPIYRALDLEDVMLAPNHLDDQLVTRLLKYLAGTALFKADLHIDRSAFTAANLESEPGLVGTPSHNGIRRPISAEEFEADMAQAAATPIAHRSGELKFFVGAGYNRLPDEIYARNGDLPQLLHGVTNNNPGNERLAIVKFHNPPAGLSGYTIPDQYETGASEIQARLRGEIPESKVA